MNRPAPRILHLINDLDVGGAQQALVELLLRADHGRFDARVVTLLPDGALTDAVRDLGIDVHALGMRRGVADVRALLRFRRLLREWTPDILQTWMYHANLFGLLGSSGLAVGHTVWNLRASIAKEHGVRRGWVERLCARLSRRPAAVIVNSEAGRQTHAALGYRPRRWEVLPNGFDLDRYAPLPGARDALVAELGCAQDAMVMGTFARWHPVKGHALLFEAFATIARAHPALRLVLAGAGLTAGNAELMELLFRYGILDRVHLLGQRRDMSRLVAAVDLLVSPSHSEGFPNVVGEAMAAATPCVATDAGGTAEVIGEAGLVVPVGDAPALAQAIQRLARMGVEERRALGEAARARVARNFELGAVAQRYEDFYQELVGV